jgi:hypothetical protein
VKLSVALILVEWAAGMLIVLGVVHRLARIGSGFTWLIASTGAAVAALAALAGREEQGTAATWRELLSIALAAGGLAEVLARVRGGVRADSSRGWRLPVVLDAAVGGLGILAAAAAGFAGGGGWLSSLRALVGALFLGSVTVGMVVGHWYLVDTSLPRSVIRRVALAYLVATVLEGAVLAAPRGMASEIAHSHRVGLGAVLPGFWVALLALSAALGVGVLGALRERGYPAVMAATGLLYLAVVTAFGVDVLAKALISRAL